MASLRLILRWVVAAVIAAMVAVSVAGVIFRYVLQASLVWADTVAIWLFIWATFLAAPAGIRKGAHMAVDAVPAVLPASTRRVLGLFVAAVVALACGVLVWSGYLLLDRFGARRDTALGIQVAWVMAAIPAGSALMLVEAIAVIVEQARHREEADFLDPAAKFAAMAAEEGVQEDTASLDGQGGRP